MTGRRIEFPPVDDALRRRLLELGYRVRPVAVPHTPKENDR